MSRQHKNLIYFCCLALGSAEESSSAQLLLQLFSGSSGRLRTLLWHDSSPAWVGLLERDKRQQLSWHPLVPSPGQQSWLLPGSQSNSYHLVAEAFLSPTITTGTLQSSFSLSTGLRGTIWHKSAPVDWGSDSSSLQAVHCSMYWGEGKRLKIFEPC